MGHGDHVGDTIDDYVFARATVDDERDRRYLRRRVAAVAFVPGLLLVGLFGHWTQSGAVVVGGLAVLVVATAVAIAFPAKARARPAGAGRRTRSASHRSGSR